METCAARKKHKSSEIICSAPADLIGGNENLIDKILICLPVRSLIRFKSVSKQWNTLISDPQFGLNHTLKNPISRIPSGLFFRLTKDSTVYSIFLSKPGVKIPSFPHPFDDLKGIVQSCNGLNLFRIKHGYCVCNLVTNQLQFVPFPNLYPSAEDNEGAWFLAFDPSVSSHYKILCVQGLEYYTNRFLIFSSETGQWKDTGVTTNEVNWWWKSAKGVYLHGSFHFLHSTVSYINMCCRFDVEAENLIKIRVASSSSYPFYDASPGYFGEFNGHLHLVCSYDFKKTYHVFELDHARNKWLFKYQVRIASLQFPENGSKGAFSILSVVRGEKEEDLAIVMAIPGKVISYNPKNSMSEVLSELSVEMDELISFFFLYKGFDFPFIPTLFSLQA